MSTSSFLVGATLVLVAASPALAASIGFRETETGSGGDRPLHVSLWYPARGGGTLGIVGENRVFHGIEAVRDAVPDGQDHPLVVLSHGYGGSWRNLNWLAGELVAQGYVVAAPDHPGTTTFNRDPAFAAEIWERPKDLSRVIDAVLADPALAGDVDASRIAAIGHSLGGWTVTAAAGARFDTRRFAEDCAKGHSPRACGLLQELGLDNPRVEADLKDPRIGAFVSLDLGLARGFTPESLNQLGVPALIFGAGVDIGDLPARLESGYLAEHLPAVTSTYVEMPDAMHFSFMQLCKPGAVELIEEETPGDGIVCKDGRGRSREDLHSVISAEVIDFLGKALAKPR
ncbi:alpha/beta hydrolase family protein [Pannonibacter sp.]|uniref:alpha/beta hydrolase family protein n=1 Tax=Pannonibacter sp. TaxID=1906786 RepID=UPI003F72DBB4